MTRTILVTTALLCALATTSCDVTGTARPSGGAATQSSGYVGAPGQGAP